MDPLKLPYLKFLYFICGHAAIDADWRKNTRRLVFLNYLIIIYESWKSDIYLDLSTLPLSKYLQFTKYLRYVHLYTWACDGQDAHAYLFILAIGSGFTFGYNLLFSSTSDRDIAIYVILYMYNYLYVYMCLICKFRAQSIHISSGARPKLMSTLCGM